MPAVITDFTPRFTTNDTGDITIIGNTLMTAAPSTNPARTAQQVAAAQAGIGSLLSNNDFIMTRVDVDNDPSTIDSSQATLNLSPGATVLFAGLYWGAESSSSARNQVRFDTPTTPGYVNLTGTVIGSTSTNDYQGFVDVTSLVQAGGSGVYTVANVQANTGATDKHGGWGLVVVFRSPGFPARNLTVFDGFASVSNSAGNNNVTIPISGFQAPPSGPVNATIGVVAYEGDRGSTGDSLRLNGTVLSNGLNPANNFFNSTITNLGSTFTAKNPNFNNQLGFDIDTIGTTNLIANSATSAAINLTTGGETYFPGVVTTAIDLFSPNIPVVKAFADLNGGEVLPGDVIEYTVTLNNNGQDAATNLVFNDPIPANTTYVAGSLEILSGANAGTKTDITGDDQAEFDAGGNQVVFRLGAGADAVAGGTLAIGAATTIRFRVTVNPNAPNRTIITNQGTADFTGATTGFALSADSNAVSFTVDARADLQLSKTVNNPTPNVGDVVTFTLTLSNLGPVTATGVTVQDQLPAGLTFVSATASQGTYNGATGSWNVGTLASGATAQLVIQATVINPSPGTNTATATSEVPDPNSVNNIAAAVVIPQQADLNLTKAVDNPTPNVGDTITFTLTLTNSGPNTATNVVVSDPLPPGLTFQAATPSQGTYNNVSGIWSVGTLASGATATLTITAVVNTVVPRLNEAVASADQFDPDPSDNSASAAVVPQRADLAISKTVDNPTPNVGDPVTFTITLSNLGPNTATGVVVTDLLPPGVTFESDTPSQGDYAEATGVWTVGSLARGATATLAIVVTVDDPVQVTNTATVSDADQFDPNSANNTSAAVVTPQQADLQLAKGVNDTTPDVGEVITYTLTLTNVGPDTATNVQVSDPLPAGLAFLTATPSQGSYDNTTGLWTVGTLASGASATLTITARVDSPLVVSNLAVASADQFDPDPTDNSASATVTPPRADLAVTKTVNDATPTVGDVVTFTVRVTNNGPNAATGVTVQDTLPPGFAFQGATPSQGTYNAGTGLWTVGNLASGATATLTIQAIVFTAQPATNFATVSAVQFDPQLNNNLASVVVSGEVADLGVAKSVSSSVVSLGDTITFTVTVTNAGPSTATGVTVNDQLPAGLTFLSATASQGAYNPSTGVWQVGALAVGAPATLQIAARVDAVGTLVNTATTGDVAFDPDLTDNTSSVPLTSTMPAGLISKRFFLSLPGGTLASGTTPPLTAGGGTGGGTPPANGNDEDEAQLALALPSSVSTVTATGASTAILSSTTASPSVPTPTTGLQAAVLSVVALVETGSGSAELDALPETDDRAGPDADTQHEEVPSDETFDPPDEPAADSPMGLELLDAYFAQDADVAPSGVDGAESADELPTWSELSPSGGQLPEEEWQGRDLEEEPTPALEAGLLLGVVPAWMTAAQQHVTQKRRTAFPQAPRADRG